ncbi:MAG TPA: SBBP repeat-containing protein, partial [Blastocatellia bacterium]|nr:SBBP repeat-containing protein [Blastocatellia bacterium]
ITSGATGFGFGVVSYTVAPNPGPRRTGTITVNGKTHTVIQSPACEYAVYHYQSLGAPLRASSPPILIDRVNAFELFEVRAPADCSWLATSAFEWISFSRNDESREMAVRLLEGRGNATIKAYFTDNNDALSRREGVLDIAGRSARVIQPHNGEQFYECLYLLFLATQPGERQIGYAFRDRVLAGTPRGREYTKLYYDHSPEAVRVAMLNPLLILRSREIFERYRPVIESMISGQGAVLTRGDLDEIEAFMTTFAERGSSRMRDVIRGLARDLRDPRMHEEFGLTVIDGPRRELPASGFLGIRLSIGLIPSIGLLSACLFIISLGRRKGARSLLCVALTLLVGGGQPGPSLSTARGRSEGLASGKPAQPRLDEIYGRLPLSFEANEGQADPRVKFISRGKGYSLMLARNEATLRLPDSRSELRMKLVGADERSSIQGVDRLPSGTNYFIGEDETRWRSGVTSYARVRQSGLYPGVDMIYYGNKGNLEYDFILAPGADPHAIRIAFEGIERIDIDESGDLVLLTAGGEVRQRRPFVYQEARDRREEIPGRYVLRGREVGFEIGDYDRSRPLVIDPVLTYSTYLGGGGTDQGLGLVTDQSGNIYLTGFTSSINFPTSDAAQSISGGDEDAFIVKLSPSGDRVVYATYLGGGDRDNASQIAVDSAGNAYVTGATDSTDFPLRNGLQQASPGGPSAFVSKLSPSGSLVYSTYLGGSDTDFSTGVAVDSSGNLYVAGATASDDFPLVNAIQRSASRTLDNYVAKLSPAGDRLIYSTYLGGGGDDFVTGIAVDSSGNAYITGVTTSLDFPVRHAMQPVHGGGLLDAFLAKLSPSGDRLVYSTYLGGSGNDRALRIAADAAGNAYVTGDTDSANFPVLGGIRPEYGGSADAFAAKLNSSGSRLVYSTYLGGSGIDGATAVAVGAGGALFVTGFTNSTDFPLIDPAQQTFGGGGFDSF